LRKQASHCPDPDRRKKNAAELPLTAERLLRVHALRAADSLQLSAAPIAANHDPATLAMVCFDGRYSRYGDRFELALRLMRNEARTLTIRR
jgi:hypothetical protein